MQPEQEKWIDKHTVQKGTCSVLTDPPPSEELHTEGRGKNLSGEVLTGLDLSYADFTNANCSGTDFSGVKSMFRAKINGAKLDNSSLVPDPAWVLWRFPAPGQLEIRLPTLKIKYVKSLWFDNEKNAKVFVPDGLRFLSCEPQNKDDQYLENNYLNDYYERPLSHPVLCDIYYADSFGGIAKGTTNLRFWD